MRIGTPCFLLLEGDGGTPLLSQKQESARRVDTACMWPQPTCVQGAGLFRSLRMGVWTNRQYGTQQPQSHRILVPVESPGNYHIVFGKIRRPLRRLLRAQLRCSRPGHGPKHTPGRCHPASSPTGRANGPGPKPTAWGACVNSPRSLRFPL
jgi:hypothetical protein